MGLFGNISTINHISPSFKRNGNVPKYMHNVGKRNGIGQIANKKGKSVKSLLYSGLFEYDQRERGLVTIYILFRADSYSR